LTTSLSFDDNSVARDKHPALQQKKNNASDLTQQGKVNNSSNNNNKIQN
jgi:hypothetical protein